MGDQKGHVERTTHYEFGGPVGAFFMVLGLPIGVVALNLYCSQASCSVWELPEVPTRLSDYVDKDAILAFVAWMALHTVLALLPVGQIHEGMPLRTGEKLKYRCNAFFAFVTCTAGFIVLFWLDYPVTWIHHKLLQLAVAAILFSTALSVFLYIKALLCPNHELASGGNSGNPIYDFFIGRQLNPRIGPLDLKFVCELRPGLIGWVVINLSHVAESWRRDGSPDPALVLVALFEIFYVADACWHEPAILTTMDIVHDGFGFMLAFGDLAWVPFLYSLNAKFLVQHPQRWHPVLLVAFFVMNAIGFIIFRGSNSQKNDFRNDPYNPKLAYLETIPTESGKRLLVSGWWGLCRHPNYLGDLIMALSWSLPCGLHLLPYFYPIYFLFLLIHRNLRDEAACRQKYGADSEKYCRRVPYRIFPYIW